MIMPDAIPPELLAPCGMNCQVCYRHLTPRRACLGCRGGASNKPPHCRDCALKACAAERGVAFCAACSILVTNISYADSLLIAF